MSPEILVLILIIILLVGCYFFIYPKYAGSNLTKIAQNDLLATTVCLTVVGSIYWGSDYEFDFIITTLNWFWFTLLSFLIIEVPFSLWYMKKHNVKLL